MGDFTPAFVTVYSTYTSTSSTITARIVIAPNATISALDGDDGVGEDAYSEG